METQTPHSPSALMHVHEQLLKTSARQQMSRYMDVKKLTDKDREIFVRDLPRSVLLPSRTSGNASQRWKDFMMDVVRQRKFFKLIGGLQI